MATDTTVAPQINSAEANSYSDKAQEALRWLKDRGHDVLDSVESGFNTVTGRAALAKVAAYVQESEAVNTAMATRIYDLLDRESRLGERVSVAEGKNILHWKLLLGSFIIQGITLIAIVYLLFR